MSSAPGPAPTPDHELRLKRSALAWEIRKFRLEAKERAAADAAQLSLDRERLALERRRFEREDSLWHRLGPTLVTLVTAVLGALLGFVGVMYNNYATQRTAQRNRGDLPPLGRAGHISRQPGGLGAGGADRHILRGYAGLRPGDRIRAIPKAHQLGGRLSGHERPH